MTGVLVDALVGAQPRGRTAPGRRVVGIVDAELIEQAAVFLRSEALDDVETLVRHARMSSDVLASFGRGLCHALATEVRRVDDQGVALPPTDRVAGVGENLFRWVLRVEADDARLVHQLREDHDMGRGLGDAVIGPVAPSQGRDGRPVVIDAALPEAEQLRIVEDPVFPIGSRDAPTSRPDDCIRLHPPGAVGIRGAHAIGRRESRAAPLSGFGDRRHATVRRVGEDRVPVPAVNGKDDRAHVENAETIAAGDPAAGVAAGRRRRTIRVARDALLGDPCGHCLLDSPGVVRAHVRVVAVLRIAHERRQRVDGVRAGEIRRAAGHSRNVALPGRRGRCGRCNDAGGEHYRCPGQPTSLWDESPHRPPFIPRIRCVAARLW